MTRRYVFCAGRVLKGVVDKVIVDDRLLYPSALRLLGRRGREHHRYCSQKEVRLRKRHGMYNKNKRLHISESIWTYSRTHGKIKTQR